MVLKRTLPFQIVYLLILLAIATALSFGTFNFFDKKVFLVGVAIFVMPLLLKIHFSILGAIIASLISDAINANIETTYVTMIGYGLAVVVVWLFTKLHLSIFLLLGLFLGSGVVVLVNYFFHSFVTSHKFVIADLASNGLQFVIIIPATFILSIPMRILRWF